MLHQFTDPFGRRWRAETSGLQRDVMGLKTVGVWCRPIDLKLQRENDLLRTTKFLVGTADFTRTATDFPARLPRSSLSDLSGHRSSEERVRAVFRPEIIHPDRRKTRRAGWNRVTDVPAVILQLANLCPFLETKIGFWRMVG
jgi:hypothetical protein